jgi:hypothetical protein
VETGPLRTICPTEHCHAIPMDWVRPTEDLIKIAMLEAERRRNGLIIRAGRATRSLLKKNDKQYEQQNEA